MFHLLVLIHRYLGIAIGLIVTLWCLSGFVMMYVQYPDLNEWEYLTGLPDIDTSDCCIANEDVLDQLAGVDEISLEMLAGQPVLRTRFGHDISVLVNLSNGWWFPTINQETALQQADAFLSASGNDSQARFVTQMERDQWTVAGYFDVYRPLYLVTANDEAATQLYVSGINGQIVQMTSSTERFWNWFGAVIHWIYPTALRQNVALWSQVVIWLSIASLFLVVVGIYLGIKQFGARTDGTKSPYRGLNLWHHYAGLVFGLFTLIWLFSGLMSMNPWGAFEGDAGSEERQRLAGGSLSSAQIAEIVAALDKNSLPEGTVQLRSSILDGELTLIARHATGHAVRLNSATLEAQPLRGKDWARVADLVRPGESIQQAGFMDAADNYYFSHHEEVAFPVYRIVFDDAGQTRYYFDPSTAELLQKYDSERRWNRWLFLGLHRGDFTAFMRQRPLWDLILLSLMLGVTTGTVTGVWMAVRRLAR